MAPMASARPPLPSSLPSRALRSHVDDWLAEMTNRAAAARVLIDCFEATRVEMAGTPLEGALNALAESVRESINAVLCGNAGPAGHTGRDLSLPKKPMPPQPAAPAPARASKVTTTASAPAPTTAPAPAAAHAPAATPAPTAARGPEAAPTPAVAVNDWVTVARKGARAAKEAGKAQNVDLTQGRKPATPAAKDPRLFLRVPSGHKWRKLSPFYVRGPLADAARTPASAIQKITCTNTGFAITAATEGARSALLEGACRLPDGIQLDEGCQWHSTMAPNVPDTLVSAEGPVPVTAALVVDEAARICGARPVAARPLKKQSPSRATNWVLHFTAPPPSMGMRLFEEAGRLREWKRPQPISQCARCCGHHPTRACSRAVRCVKCGAVGHSTGECERHIPRCVNCHGPHEATDTACLARPLRTQGKIVLRSREQMNVIRARGQAEYNARLKDLEASAAASSMAVDAPQPLGGNAPTPE